MNKDKIKELGLATNFSLAQYTNPLDEQNTRRARQVTTAFIEGFATFCKENGYEMAAGMEDFEAIGIASYFAVKHKDDDTVLMMLLTPQDDIININEEEDRASRDD